MSSEQRTGALYIFLSVCGYSLLPIWVKTIQASGMNSLDIVLWRFVLAAPIFWLIVSRMRGGDSARPLPYMRLIGMGTLLMIAATAAVWGLERLPAGPYVVLFYTYPALVAILSALLGERLSGRGWAALALTTVGIVLTVPDFGVGLSDSDLTGVLLALINALVVAFYFILSSRLLRGHTALARASATSVTGAMLALIVLLPLRGGAALPQGAETWLSIVALATLSTVLPVFFMNAGIQKVGAPRAAILGTVEPLLTALLAAIFLGEQMLPVQLVGGAFILASVLLLQTQRR
ncbi:MAG: DMT family transporter [Anaerolineae bacterium]|nr:DMT family transporter [Anaerolineae bacterium]